MLTIYVDDSIVAGPDEKIVRQEQQQIMAKFPGKIVDPIRFEDGGQTEVRDLLG